ncbi:MAG TPA: glycosyltransferase family 4 protein [Polyangia bacterium]|nr:glycosyltransferase family 4 protein [Polyangia bacterium]
MPRLLLAYHFFHPDDVVSARIFSDLAVEQQRRGWEVSVVTSNRSCFDRARVFPAFEDWNGVQIHRVFRPPWTQSRPLQRLANSGWMTAAWLAKIAALSRSTPFDAVIVGSDPAFSPALARGLRRLLPRAALVHWCFDLYPEAIAAEGATGVVAALVPLARGLMRWGYGAYDALVDIGPRMQERLRAYGTGAAQQTLVPWALAEPPSAQAADPGVRAELYPRAKLGLLYSGTMGRAHDHRAFLALARACRARSGDDVGFCFASRGNRQDELAAAVTPEDTNVRLVPFADEAALRARLGAADIHLVSLQPQWAGVVVPSKFFGSLAVGRPLLYAGPADSEIARWIGQYDVGLTLGDDVGPVADRLHALARQPEDLARWQANAFAVYRREFSKEVVNDRWDEALRALVRQRAGGA